MSVKVRHGMWHYRFEVAGHEWTANTGLVGTERNRKSAERVELEARQMVEQGKGAQLRVEAIPFSDAADQFLAWCKAHHRNNPNTWKRTRGSLSSLRVHFGRTPVNAITQGDIADYAAWRANEHKVEDVTIRHDLHNLSKFFQYAIKHNWRRDNPVHSEDIPSDEDAVRMYIFNPLEEAAYLQAAERFPKLHALVSLMCLQGCRPDELLAVELIHVDLEHRYLRIEKSKTKAGKRRLRIRPEALPILALLVKNATGPYLFASERSARRNLSLSTVENWHVRVRAATKIPCVIYDWRHTFATRAANGKMSLANAREDSRSRKSALRNEVRPPGPGRAGSCFGTTEPDGNRTEFGNRSTKY
jgi:integrase